MRPEEKESIIRRLEERFASLKPLAFEGPDKVHRTLDRMVNAGACRFGVSVDQPHRAGFSACDLAPPLARMIDHTALKPETTQAQIRELCQDAARYCFASVCVNPCHVKLAAELLRGSPVAVCTVIGFPLGATASPVKTLEAEIAVQDGASEVDMVINVGMLKSEQHDFVEADIRGVVEASRAAAANRGGVIVKVILETALLSDEEKVIASVLSQNAGADFVKTSTGFSKGGATAADVALMRRVVGPDMGIKASGGVRTKEDAETMIASGATRIGASASVAIVQGLKSTSDY
jgi:deoxyribose-phosphate aldolase